ncbi:MAG TPA: DUF523 domain-containing protein [Nitrospira sp.]|nr:DUF523 domain-containing protein [Nitrospira sp.]
MTHVRPIRLGISRCLLGDHVRYDGGHKRNRFVTEVLGKYVEWVPVCPEVEAGLGTPREPMQLVGRKNGPRLVTVSTRQDRTTLLKGFSTQKMRELRALGLSGFVFKSRSPSCGIEKVPVYDGHGVARSEGIGVFAQAFRKAFPRAPITDEDCLTDPAFRDEFLNQVYRYHDQKNRMKKSMLRRSGGHQRKRTGIGRRRGAR